MENGGLLKVTPGTTLRVRYARLPVIDLSSRFMVQIMEPIAMIPSEQCIPLINHLNSDDPEAVIKFLREPVTLTYGADDLNLLKKKLLDEWQSQFIELSEDDRSILPPWMLTVNSVELIECDLLTPKP